MPGALEPLLFGPVLALGLLLLFLGIKVRPLRGPIGFGSALLASALIARLGKSGPLPAGIGLALAALAAAGAGFLIHRFLGLHLANRRAVEALERAFANLRVSARYRELGVSAASISHEIRNYAATLKGNALLLDRNRDGQARGGELDRIRTTAERMESISRDISALADAATHMRRQPLDLESLLRECLGSRFRDLPAAFSVSGESRILGDAVRLEMAFLNFARNSREAGAGRLAIRLSSGYGKLVVALEDDGQGCPIGDLERIGTPFFSRKEAMGTGLGCFIAESLLRAHGATVRTYDKGVLGLGASGMILNIVFPLEGAAGPALAIPVRSGEGAARENILRPILNLGMSPSFSPAGEPIQVAPGGAPFFMDRETAREAEPAAADDIVVVDENRAAIRYPSGKRFPFSEESLLHLLKGTDPP